MESDSGLGTAQHEFIKVTHYVPALENLKKVGIDLSGREAAVQDALWSASVQFGNGNEKAGVVTLFKKVLAGKNIDALSDRETVATLQDYKLAHNENVVLAFVGEGAHRDGTACHRREKTLARTGRSGAGDTAASGNPLGD